LNHRATTDSSPRSLHDALPISLNLSESLNQSARHVQLLAALPNTRMALASHEPQLAAAARNRQAQAFAQLLHFHPQHSQLRLIRDRKSTRLNSSHVKISYAVFC